MSPATRGGADLLRRFVAGTFVVFIHLATEISSYQKVRNRFFRQWDTGDAVALTIDVLVLGVLVTALFQLLDRPGWPRVRGALRALFVLALVSGVVANIEPLHRPHFFFFELLWMAIAGVAGYSYGRPQSRLVRFCYRGAVGFSALIPILLVQMFTWSTWKEPERPQRVSFPQGPARPVFVFVFDEWSYMRAAPNGEFRADLPHLRALAGQSLFFRNAHSPGDDTYRSLPLLVYGDYPLSELPRVFAKEGKQGREYVTGSTTPHPVESIHQIARAAGYNTAHMGFYLPWEWMLGDSMDFCRGYPYYPIAKSLGSKMALHALEALRYETDPASRQFFRRAYAVAFTRHWLALRQEMQDGISTVIDRMPANTLAFIHYPLPHAPFVFNADGGFRGVYPVDWHLANDDQDRMLGTEEDYERQMQYLDRMVGDLVERLRRAGKFDDALIVMTSDHSWRYDPEPRLVREFRRRVPLIVKLPGQRQGCVVEEPFANVEYREFVRHVLTGASRDPEVERLIARCGAR